MPQQYTSTLEIDESERLVLTVNGSGDLNGRTYELTPGSSLGLYTVRTGDKDVPVVLTTDGINDVNVSLLGYTFATRVLANRHHDLLKTLLRSPAMLARVEKIVAPMPGLIKSVQIANEEAVTKGQSLFTLEAMKMENAISSPMDGTVQGLSVEAGKAVEKGEVLCIIAPNT